MIVMEDCEGSGCLSDAPHTDRSNGFEGFGEPNDSFGQFITSEAGIGRRGKFAKWNALRICCVHSHRPDLCLGPRGWLAPRRW